MPAVVHIDSGCGHHPLNRNEAFSTSAGRRAVSRAQGACVDMGHGRKSLELHESSSTSRQSGGRNLHNFSISSLLKQSSTVVTQNPQSGLNSWKILPRR